MLHSPRRTLVQALIVSALVHAVLLLGVARLPPVRLDATVTTINVVVNLDDHRDDPVKPADVPATKLPAAPVKPVTSSVRKAPEQSIIAAEHVPDVRSTGPAPTLAQDVVTSAPALPVAANGGDKASTPTSAPAREGVSAEDKRGYLFSLAVAYKKFKRYPPLAKERGWEGTVEVALNFNVISPLPEIVISHSSGRAILDEQALEMVTQAVRVTILPESLRGRNFRILSPVEFGLKDD